MIEMDYAFVYDPDIPHDRKQITPRHTLVIVGDLKKYQGYQYVAFTYGLWFESDLPRGFHDIILAKMEAS